MGKNDLLKIMKLLSCVFVLSGPPGIFLGEEIVGNYPKVVFLQCRALGAGLPACLLLAGA